MVIGGYIANDQRWQAYLGAWQQAMESYRVKAFHMAECASGLGPYARWGHLKCQARAAYLVRNILNKHLAASFAVGLRKAVYNTVCADLENEMIGGVYTLATLACMKLAKDWALKRGYTEPISYTLEAGGSGSAEVFRTVEFLAAHPELRKRYLVHELVSRDKISAPQLQAADLVVHQVNRAFRRVSPLPRDRVSVVDWLQKKPHFWKTLRA